MVLRDAYRDALADGPLPLSTHADDFRGCLDYCWVSTGEVPAQGEQSASATPSRVEVLKVLSMPYDLARPELFGKIPDADFASDHLAIGCEIGVPLRQQISRGDANT